MMPKSERIAGGYNDVTVSKGNKIFFLCLAIVQVILGVLKFANIIDLPWVLVLMPLIVFAFIVTVIFIIIGIIFIVCMIKNR